MKFKVNQIYYNEKLDFLFIVTDLDMELNRAMIQHDNIKYPSNWLTDLIYIGDLY